MNKPSLFSCESWVEYEHEPSNVVHLNTPYAREHAQRNAAYAAQLVEEDRRVTRMAEIEELVSMHEGERDRLNTLIFTLENEHELLRKSR